MARFVLIAFVLSGAFCWCEEGELVRPVVTELMKHEYPKDTGQEGRMLLVEFAPGGGSPAHKHPGAVFVYVLEGSVLTGLNEGEVKIYKAGESWYEEPGCIHRVARNASQTEKAKLLVFFVTQPGSPAV